MKRTLKAILASFLLAVMCFAFAACGGLSGTYQTDSILNTYVTYTFKGDDVTITSYVVGTKAFSIEGKYEIDDNEITFTFSDGEENANEYSGTKTFEKGDGYIKIGGVTLNEAK